ncbi:VanW family protein [Clostridium nigeriense]|uniref:VanW family protein n=1 Tax=Clostridium nigeriense TaxID=1805470 RepID=UPI003D35370C
MDNNITPQTNELINKPKNKMKKIVFFVILAIIILVGATVTYLSIKNRDLVNSYNDKVYPGTFVFDEDVSGLTKNELHNVLEAMVNDISSRKINISIGDNTFEESYLDFDTTIDYETFENEVFGYGKDMSFFEKLNLIKKPESKTYEFDLTYSDEKISTFLDKVNDHVLVNPTDAGVTISNGTVNITPSTIGYELNKEDLTTKIETALSDVNGENLVSISGQLNEVQPYITAEALQTVDTKISSYTTHFPAGPSGTNIIRGAGMIGSRVLMPGDEFSTVEAIGPTTLDRGFVSANTYLNGKVVPGLGGGVCQISSTIYNAELRAGIIPTYRMNHEMTVSYVPQGLDATIGDEWPDLIFENPYDYPIVVNVYSDGSGSITAEFWSNSQATGGITYEPKAYQTGTLSADTYLYGYNSAGEQISEVYLDSSVYKPFS